MGDYVIINYPSIAGPHFGFEVDLPPTVSADNSNTSRQLLEGRSAEICLLLLEPNEFETDVQIGVIPSSVSESSMYYVIIISLACFINPPVLHNMYCLLNE